MLTSGLDAFNDWLPISPYEALSFKLLIKLLLKKSSLSITQPRLTFGKISSAYCLSKRELTSCLRPPENKYFLL